MPNAATSNPPMTETIDSANAAASTLFLGQNGEWWDFWLIVSLVLVALAAIAAGITTTGSIVSHKRESLAADTVLEHFKLETENKISDANARAAEAQLALAKYKAPRNLAPEQKQKLIADLRPFPPVEYDISYTEMEPGSFLVADLIEVLSAVGWTIRSYDGPLPKKTLPLIPAKRIRGPVPEGGVIVGVVSGTFGIKIVREFRSQAPLMPSITLTAGFIEFGIYSVWEDAPHRYEGEGMSLRQLPTSEVLHIEIGSKT